MALNNLSITVQIEGTTNDGVAISESVSGNVQCSGVVEVRRTFTDTAALIWSGDTGDGPFSNIVVINEGDQDGKAQIVDPNGGETYSTAIPAGAMVIIPWMFSTTGIVGQQVSLAAYTSQTTTFKYFVLV